jgi:hypothetical protein
MTKRRAYEQYADSELPQPHGIDRQQGQDGAELDQNREALAEVLVAETQELLQQQKMAGRGDRQKLGQPLGHAEDGCLDDIERHDEFRGGEGAVCARLR